MGPNLLRRQSPPNLCYGASGHLIRFTTFSFLGCGAYISSHESFLSLNNPKPSSPSHTSGLGACLQKFDDPTKTWWGNSSNRWTRTGWINGEYEANWQVRATVYGLTLTYRPNAPAWDGITQRENKLIETGYVHHLEFSVSEVDIPSGAGEPRVALYQADTSVNLDDFQTYDSIAALPYVPISADGTYTFPYTGRLHRTMRFFCYIDGFVPPTGSGSTAYFWFDGASAQCTSVL